MILPPILDIRRTTPFNTEFFSPDDIEQQQQVRSPQADFLPVVTMASSSGGPSSRPLPKSPNRPLPIPPSVLSMPRSPQQEDMIAQMEEMRNKMAELEKNPSPAQHIILDDMQKQLNWLNSQVERSSVES